MGFTKKITTGIKVVSDTQARDIEALNRLIKSKESTKKPTKNTNVVDRYSIIRAEVSKHLGNMGITYDLIKTQQELEEYVNCCIQNGIVAIDTETTGLDPITVQLVGFSLCTLNRNPVYIPVNHIGYVTQTRLAGQLSEIDCKPYMEKLKQIKTIFHNAKYDIRVLKNTMSVWFDNVYWDTMLGAKLMREDESAALKFQYAKIFEGKDKKDYDFDSLFGGLDFRAVPLDIACIYGAADAYKTLQLYLYQQDWFNLEENKHVKEVMLNIEMPLLPAVAEMEETGVTLNNHTCQELSYKYHDKALKSKEECERIIQELYGQQIAEFRIKNPEAGSKLSNPVAITSPAQLAVLMYDIAKLQCPDSRTPRGTGEEIIVAFGDKLPFGKALLEYRHNLKLLSTYIDKLPECVNIKTGKIHASFHQYGAATGRFSSSDPNLQNIPAKGEAKEIRHIFTASPGYKLVGSDFSQQEPRALCHFCKDPNLTEAYRTGRDIYAWMASIVYKLPYEQCLEFYPEGTTIQVDGQTVVTGKKTHTNWEGKKRRANMKTVVLALLYGQSVQSTAEQLNITKQEAQNLWNMFFQEFPKVRDFINQSQEFAKKYGYVETAAGRRRHLPDMMLSPYTFERVGSQSSGFNVTFDDDIQVVDTFDLECQQLTQRLTNCKWWKERQNIINDAYSRGIKVIENTMKISDAERQCCNSRIQGSAADISKIAMYALYTNKELKSLGYRMLMCIHDEVIGECPEENVERVAELVPQVMTECVSSFITVPMKCDVAISTEWEGA